MEVLSIGLWGLCVWNRMTASLIFIEKDANFTEGEDMNSSYLGKMCCLAVAFEESVTFFFGWLISTYSNKLTQQEDHLL